MFYFSLLEKGRTLTEDAALGGRAGVDAAAETGTGTAEEVRQQRERQRKPTSRGLLYQV